ncbi:MAG TPA: acyl-CoA thioester hydrolase/BAAT C-terminal domain-containing protein [Hyphomonadaceae bacterium]|nr:acyl-CoA thioester hydrolase/BAAT C-terminal domain-containing protein [Hyphomonadaceae bacterium]
MTGAFLRQASFAISASALALCSSSPALAQTPGATVTITVEGVRSDGGQVTGSLCADPKTPFCSTYVARTKSIAGRTELRFQGVAPGRYALSTVHDEDGDGRTEIPPEGFAFGNNAPAPTFDISSIQVAGNTASKVTLTYPGAGPAKQGSRGVEAPAGTVRVDIRQSGLYGELYMPKNPSGRLPVVILVEGSSPGLDGISALASTFAREGFAALALAYYGETGLPQTLEGVRLEYFDAAVAALKARSDIDGDRLGVLAVSRGTEAAFLLAARNPAIRAVAAVGPSSVVWQGYDNADPVHSDPAWTAGGQPAPFLSADVSLYDPNGPQTPMFVSALAKAAARSDVVLPVEKTNGPILLMSGQKDEIWPSPDMAQRIEARLLKSGFAHDVENIVFAGAGHHVLAAKPEAMAHALAFFRQALKK